MAIQVTLEDHTGNISHQARVDENAEAGQLIPAIITALRLPITDNAGRPITYDLSHANRRLQENETLSSAEVQSGDTLTIVPAMSLEYTNEGGIDNSEFSELFSRLISGKSIQRLPRNFDKTNVAQLKTLLVEGIEPDCLVPDNIPAGFRLNSVLRAHKKVINQVAWSPNGRMLASSARDGTIRLWNVETGNLVQTFIGHSDNITSIAWAPDGEIVASGCADQSIWFWDVRTGQHLRTLTEGIEGDISKAVMRIGLPLQQRTTISRVLQQPDQGITTCLAWSPDGEILASSADRAIWLWDTKIGERLRILTEHTGNVNSLTWSHDGKLLTSGSSDQSAVIWNTQTWQPRQVLIGHTGDINNVTWSPNGAMLATSSDDYTVRIWDTSDGWPMRILEGHSDIVICTSFSSDGHFLASQSIDGTILLWHTDTWQQVAVLKESPPGSRMADLDFHPRIPVLATSCGQVIHTWDIDLNALAPSISSVQYVNAKVALVGDSGVGKSGLSLVLTRQRWVPTISTHDCHVWIFDSEVVPLDQERTEMRETFLWDLAGQPGYRLTHQLRLNTVAVAMIVFDAHSETDPFAGVHYWDRALRQVQRIQGDSALPMKKFLVAARIDRGGLGVSRARIDSLVNELKFDGYFATSAMTRQNVTELAGAIRQNIDWDALPKVTSTSLFQQIREFLKKQKDAELVLSTIDGLYHSFLESHSLSDKTVELRKRFETCIELAEAQNLIRRLSFSDLILLQPEILVAYASDLVNSVKDEPDGLGSIAEKKVLMAEFFISPEKRLQNRKNEKLLLIAMIEDLLHHEIALREETDDGTYLVFPSQCTREHPDMPEPEGKTIVFRFEGPVLNIYATLAVRLSYSGRFKRNGLWKNAVTYTTEVGGTCGIFLHNRGEGLGNLTLFFDKRVSEETQFYFERYIHEHLKKWAIEGSIQRQRIFVCLNCSIVIPNQMVQSRLARGINWLNCPVCSGGTRGKRAWRISLLDGEARVGVIIPSIIDDMDTDADNQREREERASVLQGKTATGSFDVFLCHNNVDKPLVKKIGEQLKELGILPWLDEWELRPGFPWQHWLNKQIDQINGAAVFVGRNGRGPWEDMELYAFLERFVQREQQCPIIPVILPDCENEPDLSGFLKIMTWVDFRRQDPDPMKQLYWGITGKRI